MTELSKNNPEKAVEVLKSILGLNPDNEKLPKIYYALGWIYENNLMNLDSSVKYYKLLREKFPSSVYTISIIAKLDVIAPEKIENTPKDSLNLKTDTTVVLNDSITGNLIVKDSLTNDLIELPPEDSSFIPLPKDTTIRQIFIEQ
jgi:tetratricopeptide (TPR) repeat protein